jgi:hypothetical protein
MKYLVVLLSVMVLCAGCRTKYDITLSNGNKITGVSKPVLNKETGFYEFKLANGKQEAVKSMRVRTIEPAGEEDYRGGFRAPSR